MTVEVWAKVLRDELSYDEFGRGDTKTDRPEESAVDDCLAGDRWETAQKLREAGRERRDGIGDGALLESGSVFEDRKLEAA